MLNYTNNFKQISGNRRNKYVKKKDKQKCCFSGLGKVVSLNVEKLLYEQ